MKKKKRGKKAGSIAMAVLLLALVLLIGYNVLQAKHVKVIGNTDITADEITRLVAIPTNTELLFVDEKQIKTNIEGNPYLQLKSVDYELPDTVVITVYERKPAALMPAGNSFLLLDRQFVVLKDNDSADAGKYPLIDGITIKTAELGKQVDTDDSAKIPSATAILDELEKQDATGMVTQISLTDINNIVFKTKNGPEVLFGQTGGEAAKIAWIVKLLPDLIKQGKTTGMLDVTAGTFATYGTDHIPAPSAQPTQTSPKPSASPSGGVSGKTILGQTAGASPSAKAS